MTRYNWDTANEVQYYQEGVDRVIEYIASINAYPKLVGELKWAIEEGII